MGNYLARLSSRKQRAEKQKILMDLDWNTNTEENLDILKKIQTVKSEFLIEGKDKNRNLCIEYKDINSKYKDKDKKTNFNNYVKNLLYLPTSEVNNLINDGDIVENNIFDLITKMKGNDIIKVLTILGFTLSDSCKVAINNLNLWDLNKSSIIINTVLVLLVLTIIIVCYIKVIKPEIDNQKTGNTVGDNNSESKDKSKDKSTKSIGP
jgi:hypothetical protein